MDLIAFALFCALIIIFGLFGFAFKNKVFIFCASVFLILSGLLAVSEGIVFNRVIGEIADYSNYSEFVNESVSCICCNETAFNASFCCEHDANKTFSGAIAHSVVFSEDLIPFSDAIGWIFALIGLYLFLVLVIAFWQTRAIETE